MRVAGWGRGFDRYVLVGLFNTAFDFVLFSTLALAVGLGPITANVMSTLVVMTMSFFLNRTWVFRSRAGGLRTYAGFAAITLSTGLLVQSAVILGVLTVRDTTWAGLADEVAMPAAKVAAVAAGVLLNFLGYRWLFSVRDRPGGSRRRGPARVDVDPGSPSA